MRYYDPTDDHDAKAAERIEAPPWMLAAIGLNPEYCSWGPGEDYMHGIGRKEKGWGGGVEVESWDTFGWWLDEMNVCADFYFHVERRERQCPDCSRGYSPDGEQIDADVRDWQVAEGRGCGYIISADYSTGEEMKRRAVEQGVSLTCPTCDGHGSLLTDEPARLCLTLWMLHPRKGASRGVTIQCIEEADLPAAKAWLAEAARQNADRFRKVM